MVQENLVTFLEVEIDLASTMLGIAKTTKNADRRTRLFSSVRMAVETIRHFEPRIADKNQRRELLARAAELERGTKT